jgi:hypothetical protein
MARTHSLLAFEMDGGLRLRRDLCRSVVCVSIFIHDWHVFLMRRL